MTAEVTDDLFFGGAARLLQPKRGHRFGGDAALLAAAARSLMAPGARVVDLGAGVGAVGIALAAKGAGHVVLVEIDAALVELSRENAARNGLSDRVDAVAADVGDAARHGPLAAESFDLVVTNPPFDDAARHRASPDADKARAHLDAGDVIADWVAAAERLLKPGGALALIHRPEALPDLIARLGRRLGDVRIVPIHPRPDAPAGRILLGARKGGRGPLQLRPPLVMHGADGRFTGEADAAQRGGVLDLT